MNHYKCTKNIAELLGTNRSCAYRAAKTQMIWILRYCAEEGRTLEHIYTENITEPTDVIFIDGSGCVYLVRK